MKSVKQIEDAIEKFFEKKLIKSLVYIGEKLAKKPEFK
jgi:hypothetical protein